MWQYQVAGYELSELEIRSSLPSSSVDQWVAVHAFQQPSADFSLIQPSR